jgi:hypothetical protein
MSFICGFSRSKLKWILIGLVFFSSAISFQSCLLERNWRMDLNYTTGEARFTKEKVPSTQNGEARFTKQKVPSTRNDTLSWIKLVFSGANTKPSLGRKMVKPRQLVLHPKPNELAYRCTLCFDAWNQHQTSIW